MKIFVAAMFMCLFASPVFAQTPTVSWTQSNVASVAQANTLTYRLYVTPSGGSQLAAVTLTSVACTGTAPLVTCTAPLPGASSVATVTGSKSTLTTQDLAGGTPESSPSAPFTAGAAAPTALKIQ